MGYTPYVRLIKYYRLLRGLTQEELATKADISQPKISQLETDGMIKVSEETLERIARILDFPFPAIRLVDLIENNAIPA